MGRERAAAAGPGGGDCAAEATDWPEIAAVRPVLCGRPQDGDTGRTSPPGTQLAATLPSHPPGSLLALNCTQNHLLGVGNPRGGSTTCVLSQDPQIAKRRVASPSSTVSFRPARPLLAWGNSTRDIHGPKAPLRGQSLVQAKDKPLLASPRLCCLFPEPFLPLGAEGTGHGASAARTRAARAGETQQKD